MVESKGDLTADYIRGLTFKKRIFGGCDEEDVLFRMRELSEQVFEQASEQFEKRISELEDTLSQERRHAAQQTAYLEEQRLLYVAKSQELADVMTNINGITQQLRNEARRDAEQTRARAATEAERARSQAENEFLQTKAERERELDELRRCQDDLRARAESRVGSMLFAIGSVCDEMNVLLEQVEQMQRYLSD